MKPSIKLIALILIFGFSGCTCEESVIDTYLLSEYEKSLIPYNDYQDLYYINENDQKIKATTQPRIIKIEKQNPGPESCEYWEVESISNFINFTQSGFSIFLNIGTFNDITSFSLEYVIPDSDNTGNEYFENLINPSNEQVVNFNGVEFENVYVFNNNFLNEESKIELILYSAVGKGVELISFKDGKYLKLE